MIPNRLLLFIFSLVIIAGLANGTMDSLQFHYDETPFEKGSQFWDPGISWKNKYATDAEGTLIFPLRPKFFGSTTFLVFLTDGWHLMQMIMFAAFRTAIVLALAHRYLLLPGWMNTAAWILLWISLHVVQSIGFHATYSWFW